MRLARAYDESDETAQVFRRVVTPAAKFWICKRAPTVTLEAMEVLGGSGYIEESIMPRLYREAPVNSIWEGSGNVMCLDVLRAIARTPQMPARCWRRELAGSGEARLDAFADAADGAARFARAQRRSAGARAGARSGARLAGGAADQALRRRRWPMRSAPRGWRARAAPSSARCRAGSICARSSSGQGRSSRPRAASFTIT